MQHVQTHTYLQLNPATDSFNTWPAAQQCQEQLLSGLLCKVVGCWLVAVKGSIITLIWVLKPPWAALQTFASAQETG